MTNSIPTEEEKKRYGGLWNACNTAYHWTKERLPFGDKVSERGLAFTLGALSGYGVAEVGTHGYNLADSAVEFMGGDLPDLETITSHALVGTAAIPAGARVIAPEQFKNFKEDHPRYSAGVFGVMTGASLRALQEILI